MFDAPSSIENGRMEAFSLAMMQTEMMNFQRLREQFSHLVNNTGHMSLDPEALQHSLTQIGDGNLSFLNRFKRDGIFTRLVSDLAGNDFVKFFTGGAFQTILNLLAIVAIICVIGYIASCAYPYIQFRKFCCKLCCCKRQPASEQLIELETMTALPRNSLPLRRSLAYAVYSTKQPVVCVALNNVPCLALLDTGASISLVTNNILKKYLKYAAFLFSHHQHLQFPHRLQCAHHRSSSTKFNMWHHHPSI